MMLEAPVASSFALTTFAPQSRLAKFFFRDFLRAGGGAGTSCTVVSLPTEAPSPLVAWVSFCNFACCSFFSSSFFLRSSSFFFCSSSRAF